MHKYIRMSILLPINFLKRGIIFKFPCYIAMTADEVDHPWCLYSHGEFLGVLRSDFSILWSTRRSPIREQRGAITALYLVTLYIEVLRVVYSLYDCYYFINLFKVCLGSCIRAYFYPWSTRCSDSLHILSFACQATLLRVGWRGGFSYCLVPAKTGTVGF